jgi:hypothetical protein
VSSGLAHKSVGATVRTQVNVERLFNYLRHVYSNRHTFLGELMQNARRAGATAVQFRAIGNDTLEVRDDGQGISDLSTLLHLAESAWEQDVAVAENPYGMGFFAALFAAKKVTVESRGRALVFDTSDALAFHDLPIATSDVTSGTRILLEGLDIDGLAKAISSLSRGFPIPVYWDGQPLFRPDALHAEGRRFIRTPVGAIDIVDAFREPVDLQFVQGTAECTYYLQGLPVQVQSGPVSARLKNIVHLDPTKFVGRMPDRAQIYDPAHVHAAVHETLRTWWRTRLIELASALSPPIAASALYKPMAQWASLDILNENPWLPSQAAAFVKRPRWSMDGLAHFLDPVPHTLHRDDITGGKVFLFKAPALWDFVSWTYIHSVGGLVLTKTFAPDHWANQTAIDLEQRPVSYEVTSARAIDYVISLRAILCDTVVLQGPAGAVTSPFAFYDRAGQCFVHPACDTTGLVVWQHSHFRNNPLEATQEEARYRLFVRSHSENGGAPVLEDLLSGIYIPTPLRGRAYTVNIGADGAVRVDGGASDCGPLSS